HRDPAGYAGHRRGVDGHHDARDGRLRNHTADTQECALQDIADTGVDGQGDEGRPREMPGGGGLRLYLEAREYGSAAVVAEGLALPLKGYSPGAGPDPAVAIIARDYLAAGAAGAT